MSIRKGSLGYFILLGLKEISKTDVLESFSYSNVMRMLAGFELAKPCHPE